MKGWFNDLSPNPPKFDRKERVAENYYSGITENLSTNRKLDHK